MKKIFIIFTLTAMLVLSGCSGDSNPCGDGTILIDGVCILDDGSSNSGSNGPISCSNETGLHSVQGGKMYTISAWLNWTFIGGHLVTDPDNAWIQDFGAAVFNVKQVSSDPWEGSFTQSGMFLQKGCEYTFEFTLRTEAPSIKPNVIVFGENMSGLSFFEEVVPLYDTSRTYRFTVTPTSSDYVATGVYFANSIGMVIIEEIQITRHPIGTNGAGE